MVAKPSCPNSMMGRRDCAPVNPYFQCIEYANFSGTLEREINRAQCQLQSVTHSSAESRLGCEASWWEHRDGDQTGFFTFQESKPQSCTLYYCTCTTEMHSNIVLTNAKRTSRDAGFVLCNFQGATGGVLQWWWYVNHCLL